MFNNARPVSRSHDIVERKYVLTRFSLEKVLSADEVVTGRVAAINSCVYIFGNSSLLHNYKRIQRVTWNHTIRQTARIRPAFPLLLPKMEFGHKENLQPGTVRTDAQQAADQCTCTY